MKNLNAKIYTFGKFGKRIRETLDTNNPMLYSYGRYPTKITKEDLTEDYIEIHSRSIWYMDGFIKTSGVADIDYTYCKENHLFKDDYIYLSYEKPIKSKIDIYGFKEVTDYDYCISGDDIIDIVLGVEKYSKIDTSNVRKLIEEKRVWLRDNEPKYYAESVEEDCDIFDLWIRKGYIDQRLVPDGYDLSKIEKRKSLF